MPAIHRVAIFALLVVLAATPLQASFISYADIDIQPSSGRAEPGWLVLPGTVAANVNGSNLSAQALTSFTSENFTIAISNVDELGATVGGIDWRDRGDATTPATLARMAEDFVKNNSGVIRVTLGGLSAGTYEAISYHVDSDNTQSDAIKVRISTDGGATFAPPAPSVGSSNLAYGGVNGANFTMANFNALAATFGFTADGLNDIVLVFDGRGGHSGNPATTDDNETPLSGLSISVAVPEPSTMALLIALGGLGACVAMRRRGR